MPAFSKRQDHPRGGRGGRGGGKNKFVEVIYRGLWSLKITKCSPGPYDRLKISTWCMFTECWTEKRIFKIFLLVLRYSVLLENLNKIIPWYWYVSHEQNGCFTRDSCVDSFFMKNNKWNTIKHSFKNISHETCFEDLWIWNNCFRFTTESWRCICKNVMRSSKVIKVWILNKAINIRVLFVLLVQISFEKVEDL